MFASRLTGILTPAVTPFDDDKIRFDWLEENLATLNRTRIAGYLALGSNGECKSLTDAERIEVMRVFGQRKGDKVLMVGVGCESARQTIDMAHHAADSGADFASVITPSYFASRMDDATLTAFFTEVADRSPIPVVLYNAPAFAGGVTLSPSVVGTLAEHPNVAGMKDSSLGRADAYLMATADKDFAVLAGTTGTFLTAMLGDATGGVLSLANAFPEPCCALFDALRERDLETALPLNKRLLRANAAVFGKAGVAAVKASMDLAGRRGGAPRRPLAPLNEAQKEQMRTTLMELGFLQ